LSVLDHVLIGLLGYEQFDRDAPVHGRGDRFKQGLVGTK
jgi:hypothetical protein